LGDLDEPFDVVLANILAPALVELSADLVRLVAADGVLVISGVLVGRFDHVVDALAPLHVERVDELEGWAAVTLRR
jgi:ribosomal protein L11 methylase PrmA